MLIVDDSKLCRKLTIESCGREIANIDKTADVKFHECDDGVGAVTLIMQSKNYDFICMDNVMTIMGGLEAPKNIRALGYKGKIIGITGNVLKEDVEEFMKTGADIVLPKPLNRSDLVSFLASFLFE